MSIAEFERVLKAAIPNKGRTAITLTELPADENDLLRMLERAVVVGNRHRTPLAEVHAPIDRFKTLSATYWHVPIEDSGRDGAVRLVFDASA